MDIRGWGRLRTEMDFTEDTEGRRGTQRDTGGHRRTWGHRGHGGALGGALRQRVTREGDREVCGDTVTRVGRGHWGGGGDIGRAPAEIPHWWPSCPHRPIPTAPSPRCPHDVPGAVPVLQGLSRGVPIPRMTFGTPPCPQMRPRVPWVVPTPMSIGFIPVPSGCPHVPTCPQWCPHTPWVTLGVSPRPPIPYW